MTESLIGKTLICTETGKSITGWKGNKLATVYQSWHINQGSNYVIANNIKDIGLYYLEIFTN